MDLSCRKAEFVELINGGINHRRGLSAFAAPCTVSFHNFHSQIFKLSVSNPKSEYVAHLSVLSQISNCQGLGRKNKDEILKSDRTVFARILRSQLLCYLDKRTRL